MGNVSSRAQEPASIYVSDQSRFTITNLKICSSNNRTLYEIIPDTLPATRYLVRKETHDDTNIEYIQDPEVTLPIFLLRLHNDDEINFYFKFALKRPSSSQGDAPGPVRTHDTNINGLTFVFAPTRRELDTLLTREFHADPNLHKNPNVDLVGDYSTAGKTQEEFEWSWKWRPPKQSEDRGGGWRNSCSFVEYDQQKNSLTNLITFSFWVQNTRRRPQSPTTYFTPRVDSLAPPRIRVPSQKSVESRASDSDTEVSNARDPVSPFETIHEDRNFLDSTVPTSAVKVDLSTANMEGDITNVNDGPLFRSHLKLLESKSGSIRQRMKKILRKAEAAREAQINCNALMSIFIASLQETSETKPALEHYFSKIAQEIMKYERDSSDALQKMVIDPLEKIYSSEIKQAEAKKKEFDDHSEKYYKDVGKYLGQRSDSMKEKKRAESDSKHESRTKNFELKRFDYSAFVQDLHGGRKDQEVLQHLTKYAEKQTSSYLATAKNVEALMPQLEALSSEVKEAEKQYQLLRSEREEKRRALERSQKPLSEGGGSGTSSINPEQAPPLPSLPVGSRPPSEYDAFGMTSTAGAASYLAEKRSSVISGLNNNGISDVHNTTSPEAMSSTQLGTSPSTDRYKGIRDLESTSSSARSSAHRKEGLLWSSSKPGSHIDPRMKIAWHKYWVVLDQGKISEYINWKTSPEAHMEPIDLRMASVREARNQERRFCFEVLTPHYTRTYQTTGEEDMRSWIQAINNALQSAFESKSAEPAGPPPSSKSSSIAQNLFGKSSSYHGHRSTSSSAKAVSRYPTVADRPPIQRSRSSEERPALLLNQIRSRDAGNAYCADCGTDKRVEWASINLGIIVCIECSGIHRSLGTHISKIRSLTLDTNSFTQDLVELLLTLGNRVSNMIWEATLDKTKKPSPEAHREERLQFITAKYQRKEYVEPINNRFSHYSSADQTLLASVKKNEIQNVYYALALSANPNAADGSRATHVVYLALAAADPASPHAVSPKLPTPVSSADLLQPRKAFPMAELLIQNGAEIPNQKAPIPLSHSSEMYVEFKKAQRAGTLSSNSASSAHPVNSTPSPASSTKLSKRSSAGQNLQKFARQAVNLPEKQ